MTLRKLFGRIRDRLERTQPLIQIEISRSSLLHNLHAYQTAYPTLAVAPVLKSNAYGHGLSLIASVLDAEDIAFFMVDSWYEARELRRSGIRSRIVVMGYVRPEDVVRSRLENIDFAIVDREQLEALVRLCTRPVRIHVKIDVGMHRHGITPSDIEKSIALIQSNPHLEVTGVTAHIGDADNTDETLTRNQIELWSTLSKKVMSAFPSIMFRHLTATKGARFAQMADTNVLRLGIGLYGFDTSPHSTLPLKPVLSMRSIVSSVRTVPKGESVGYNATYTAERDRIIATVPAGYFEGLDRRLSNKGFLSVRGVQCPIVGRVSMNMTSIDVSEVPSVAVGDVVEVVSSDSILSMAQTANTTPYELLAHIPQHLRRVLV